MFIINEDNSHFFYTRSDEEMTREGLQGLVDGYAGTKVTHLFFSPNSMRTSYRSAVREAIWDPVDGREPDQDWPRRAHLLHQRGLDPYAVWMKRSREHGISPWISMRMNDIHNAPDRKHFMHSEFWRAHPEFHIVPHATSERWQDYSLNYQHAEVRNHQLQLVEELLERYDMDGLELDWMRFGFHFPPGRERECAPILTAFVEEVCRRVRQAAEKRGHPIQVAVRVPTHPDAALGLGMDAVQWAARGWIDLLLPCPFWRSSDFDIPLELWRERLQACGIDPMPRLLPGLEYYAAPWVGAPQVPNDLAICHGFAASAHERGADGIYLFNWMDSQTLPVKAEEYRSLLQRGLDRDAVLELPRRHPVCHRDTVPEGFPDGVQLPIAVREGGTVRIPAGHAPRRGTAFIVIGLDGPAPGDNEAWQVSLNDTAVDAPPGSAETTTLGGGPQSALKFPVPLKALCHGDNSCALRHPAADPALRIVWVELKYR